MGGSSRPRLPASRSDESCVALPADRRCKTRVSLSRSLCVAFITHDARIAQSRLPNINGSSLPHARTDPSPSEVAGPVECSFEARQLTLAPSASGAPAALRVPRQRRGGREGRGGRLRPSSPWLPPYGPAACSPGPPMLVHCVSGVGQGHTGQEKAADGAGCCSLREAQPGYCRRLSHRAGPRAWAGERGLRDQSPPGGAQRDNASIRCARGGLRYARTCWR